MTTKDVFSVDGRVYNLPVLKYRCRAEIVDGDGTGRMETWDMFRDPSGVIKNIYADVGVPQTNNDGNPDFIDFMSMLDSFGEIDFKTVSLITALGTITQKMYGASYETELRRIEHDGITYWGTISVSFIAKGPIE